MMQHADRDDRVERSTDRAEIHEIGLRVFDVREAKLARLPFCVAEARQTQIDSEDARVWKLLGRADRFAAGAASGNQEIDRASFGEWMRRREREPLAQVIAERGRSAGGRQSHPAWIRALLVLPPDCT